MLFATGKRRLRPAAGALSVSCSRDVSKRHLGAYGAPLRRWGRWQALCLYYVPEAPMRVALVLTALAAGPLVLAAPPREEPQEPPRPKTGWTIPEEESRRKSPFPNPREAARMGRALWHVHCETCHGVTGKGDGPNARLHERRKKVAPRDVSDPSLQENLTDGDILWRITKGIVDDGNVIMPPYAE